jgi:hypothetical protein
VQTLQPGSTAAGRQPVGSLQPASRRESRTHTRRRPIVLDRFWRSTLLGFVVALALFAEGSLQPSPPSGFIDCRYENPELHIYIDRIDACLP